MYRRLVIAPLNIVLYNVFGQGGPDLYGELETWHLFHALTVKRVILAT